MARYLGPLNPKQRLASERNWHLLQLKGAIGALRSLCLQTGCPASSVEDIELLLEEYIDMLWQEKKRALKPGDQPIPF